MKLLRRALLLLLCIGLLASVWMMYLNTTVSAYGHDSFYTTRWPWLHDVRQWSLYGILAWCIVFARSEATFVRLGLIAVTISLMANQLNTVHHSHVLSAEESKAFEHVFR